MQVKALLSAVVVLAAAAVAGLVVATSVPWPRQPLAPRTGPKLADARAWGYQLQRFDARAVPEDVDVLVIDYSRDGSEQKALDPAAIERLRRRQGRPPRIVLCYLSIGEAESYRYYWRPKWALAPPDWLAEENQDWQGNYAVHYWSEGWQRRIVAGAPTVVGHIRERFDVRRKPYIDRILEAGFDGVYLDRVDAFEHWLKERASAPSDMVAFVARISDYARARKPGFLIVAQNGEELLQSAPYRRAIDGVGKEDLLYGIDGEGKENAPEEVAAAAALLQKARAEGLPVFVVEYVSEPAKRAKAAVALRARGYVPLFAARGLTLPPEPPVAAGQGERDGVPTAAR